LPILESILIHCFQCSPFLQPLAMSGFSHRSDHWSAHMYMNASPSGLYDLRCGSSSFRTPCSTLSVSSRMIHRSSSFSICSE
jgi:hypothetical protein